MQYKFEFDVCHYDDGFCSTWIQEIGRVAPTSIWSVRPLWRLGTLAAMEIHRSDGDGTVEIELSLRSCVVEINDYSHDAIKPCSVFKATLGHNEKVHRIPTNLRNDRGDSGFRGHLLLDGYCCKSEDQSVASTRSSKLSDDLLHILDNPDSFPDATLICGSAEIRVHRCILFARSPVMAAMFTRQMIEGLGGTVHITDIQPEVLRYTLKYIYSGKTDGLTSTLASDLLFAADKYQLDELKSACVSKLKSSLTVDNAVRGLVLGHLHDEDLKTHVIDFLRRSKLHFELSKTEEWRSLEMEYPRLTTEVWNSLKLNRYHPQRPALY